MPDAGADADADAVVALAHAVLRASPYGFLATTGPDAAPRVRLVQHLAVDDDLRVWVGTSPRSRKAADVAARAEAVAYACEDRDAFAYVSLRGEARLVEDLDERVARWTPGLETFFPGGPRGDDFVLVSLAVDRVELMSFAAGVHPDPYGLVPAVAVRSGDGWVLEPAGGADQPPGAGP